MSYPQPDSNSAVLSGFDEFRLNTPTDSAGDIYESAQGSHAIMMGPECDYSQVLVNFFNDTRIVTGAYTGPTQPSASFVDSVILTPERGFVSEIAARNEAKYQPSNRPGRVLFSPGNLFDPNYTSQIEPVLANIRIAPVLDVIQYFSSPPNVTPKRNDKEYFYQDLVLGVALGSPDKIGIIIPFYGRKYAYISITNWDAALPLAARVIGVNYSMLAPQSADELSLANFAAIAINGGNGTKVVRASVDGMFDAIAISVTLGSGITHKKTPIKIRISDNEE